MVLNSYAAIFRNSLNRSPFYDRKRVLEHLRQLPPDWVSRLTDKDDS